jgi:hypothetical protein
MKNQQAIKEEIKARKAAAIKRGYFETPAQAKSRLISLLMKQWFNNGKLWTMRSYLLSYDRKEYKRILNALNCHYKGVNIAQLKGINCDVDYTFLDNTQ